MMTTDDKEKFLSIANKSRKKLFTMADIHEGSPPEHLCHVIVYTDEGTVHEGTYNLRYGFYVSIMKDGRFSHYDAIDNVKAYIKN